MIVLAYYSISKQASLRVAHYPSTGHSTLTKQVVSVVVNMRKNPVKQSATCTKKKILYVLLLSGVSFSSG